jgi:hypothetical protein
MIAAALLSYAVSNNTGHACAAGGSIRLKEQNGSRNLQLASKVSFCAESARCCSKKV